MFSDSGYVVNAVSLGWAPRWKAKDWVIRPTRPRLNADLRKSLLDLCEVHEVVMNWVKGHDGNRENERCDQLAVTAARMKGLPPDPGYLGDQAPVQSIEPRGR